MGLSEETDRQTSRPPEGKTSLRFRGRYTDTPLPNDRDMDHRHPDPQRRQTSPEGQGPANPTLKRDQ